MSAKFKLFSNHLALLHTLLEFHTKNQPRHALSGVLGDGYLLTHNPIYSRVREGIVAEKIEFSTNVPNEVAVLPLGQLEMFLNSKKIWW